MTHLTWNQYTPTLFSGDPREPYPSFFLNGVPASCSFCLKCFRKDLNSTEAASYPYFKKLRNTSLHKLGPSLMLIHGVDISYQLMVLLKHGVKQIWTYSFFEGRVQPVVINYILYRHGWVL